MILNGKALTDFGLFLVSNYKIADWDFFYTKPIVSQNALIIEWLDSVDIHISISADEDIYKLNKSVYFIWFIGEHSSIQYNSRQEATKKAIDKANNLYNEHKTV